MELRVLRYFLTVAREQNISAAAEILHITQPTLSRQLMELEDELGTPLMIRGRKNRRIALTEAGMLLRQRAEEMVSLADRTEADFAALDGSVGGEIHIGAGETNGMRLVARAAQALRRSHPQVRFHLYSGDAEMIAERLDKGLLDFGLMIGGTDEPRYNALPLPYRDRWGLLMRVDDPLAAKPFIRASDLEDVPLLVSRQALRGHGDLNGWMGRELERWHLAGSYNLIFNATLMVEQGIGCALTFEGLVRCLDANCPLCFRPLQPALECPMALVWKKYQFLSRASELFLERLRAEIDADLKSDQNRPNADDNSVES